MYYLCTWTNRQGAEGYNYGVILSLSDIFREDPVHILDTKKSLILTVLFPVTTRVRNLKFATYLKFATCENTNKINELW